MGAVVTREDRRRDRMKVIGSIRDYSQLLAPKIKGISESDILYTVHHIAMCK